MPAGKNRPKCLTLDPLDWTRPDIMYRLAEFYGVEYRPDIGILVVPNGLSFTPTPDGSVILTLKIK